MPLSFFVIFPQQIATRMFQKKHILALTKINFVLYFKFLFEKLLLKEIKILKDTMVTIKKAYNETFKTLRSKPVVFLPFLVFATLEFITLIVIYLAPRMPLKLLLAPPIRTIWGEGYLHYPLNFLLIPKLASFARMGLTILVGSLLTGAAVSIIYDIYKHKKANFIGSLKSALKKYISLFTIVLIFTVLFYISEKITFKLLVKYFISGHAKLLFLGPQLWLGPILICINITLAVILQSAFIYAIPILMIENEKLMKSILKSFSLFKKLFFKTVVLVGLPMLIYIPLLLLQSNPAILIDKFFPEAVLWLMVVGLLVNSLILDLVITVSTTHLYLLNKEKAG